MDIYFSELSLRLQRLQIKTAQIKPDRLDVLFHDQTVFFVSLGGDIFLLSGRNVPEEVSELYHQVSAIADEVYEYVEAMENAPLLHASGLHEQFHLLANFGGAVLAGRERENGQGYQFVTWIWDYDRRGVSHGHYYEGNFRLAKQDFAVRSGLISRAQLFTPEELTELYRATDYLLEEGPEPDSSQLKAIQTARTKIEYTIPDLQTRLEPEQGQAPQQMNL